MTCSIEDAAKLNRLFRKYVGSGSVSASRLRDVIKREAGAAEKGVIKVSSGLLRELRADRAVAGRLAKVCRGTDLAGYSKSNRRSRRSRRASKRRY